MATPKEHLAEVYGVHTKDFGKVADHCDGIANCLKKVSNDDAVKDALKHVAGMAKVFAGLSESSAGWQEKCSKAADAEELAKGNTVIPSRISAVAPDTLPAGIRAIPRFGQQLTPQAAALATSPVSSTIHKITQSPDDEMREAG